MFRFNENKKDLDLSQNNKTFAQKIENNRLISLFAGLSLLFFIFFIFYKTRFSLDLNLVSWTFLGIGLLLASSPIQYVKLVNKGNNGYLIILQYPFYAGIMGIMSDTGLINVIATKLRISSAETLGFYFFIRWFS